MSLFICWSNDCGAHVISDGLSLGGDGKPVSFKTRKFFETASGIIVGACGFSHLCGELQRRLSDSTAGFQETTDRVAAFVRWAWERHKENAWSQPIGCAVIGFDARSGRMRSANVAVNRVTHSIPGGPNVHWLTAAPLSDSLMQSVAYAIRDAAPADVPRAMREGARRLFEKFPGRMGGEIFTAALSAESAAAHAVEVRPAPPRVPAQPINASGCSFGVFTVGLGRR